METERLWSISKPARLTLYPEKGHEDLDHLGILSQGGYETLVHSLLNDMSSTKFLP